MVVSSLRALRKCCATGWALFVSAPAAADEMEDAKQLVARFRDRWALRAAGEFPLRLGGKSISAAGGLLGGKLR